MLGDEPRQPATPRRILVVEDNELNLKLLADLLEYQGYGVTVTTLGEAAVDLALNSALLKSRFDQPGSAVIAMARMASPSQAAAIRMNATASSV